MDEDIERFKMLSKSMTDTIVQAYINRFPKPTMSDFNIIIASLSEALYIFISSLPKELRSQFYLNIVRTYLECEINE